MRTNIEIDDKLMKKALRASGEKTKKGVVEAALQLLVKLKQQERALQELRGAAKWEGDLEQSRIGRFADQEW
jgi:Arc/MetJ family transcription regulator